MWSGSKIKLRPPRIEDAETSVAWRNDPEIVDNVLGFRGAVSLDAERGWIERAMADTHRLVLAIEADSDLVGYAYLQDIDNADLRAEIGILIGDKTRHRRGVGTEAVKLLCRLAFDEVGVERVFLRVVAYNRPAIALYERLGFVREGVWRRHVHRRGARHDVILMGLLVGEWRAIVAKEGGRDADRLLV